MPDTPPVVTISLCSDETALLVPFTTPLVALVMVPLGAVAVPPFIAGPLMVLLPFVDGSESAEDVWSAWDMGKEKELGATKALA